MAACSTKKSRRIVLQLFYILIYSLFYSSTAACAAATHAIGTRIGEQET